MISINREAFDQLREMAANTFFIEIARVGEERKGRQYLLELVTRFVVLRHYPYKKGLDVHEFLDRGIIEVAEQKEFDWVNEKQIFVSTMSKLNAATGELSFLKNNRFSLAMFEFIALGLSKLIEKNGGVTDEQVKERVAAIRDLPEAERYSGIGVRGTQRLSSFVVPLAEKFFANAVS